MAKDFSGMEDSNRSSNLSIHDISSPERRTFLKGGLGTALGGLLAPLAGQVVVHLHSYWAEESEVRNVLDLDRQLIAKNIHAQMAAHS